MRRTVLPCPAAVLVLLAAACPSRELPPPPSNEPPQEQKPACGKVFRDPRVREGSACCSGTSAEVLKKSDVMAVCGRSEADFLGETRDHRDCRYHFRVPGVDPKESFVMVNRPMIPPGSPAPVRPDPYGSWTWKKIQLRDAIGFQAATTPDEPGTVERQNVVWAARGRKVVGMRVAKAVCTEAQAQALLQKAIDSATP